MGGQGVSALDDYQATAREEDEQIALFDMIRQHEAQYPILKYAFHCPNGGHRQAKTAGRMKAAGVRRGVPDFMLAISLDLWPFEGVRRVYRGLALELKVKPNKPTSEQLVWLEMLASQQWYVKVCYGWQEAWEIVLAYVQGRMT